MDIKKIVQDMISNMSSDMIIDQNDREETINDFQNICGYSEEDAEVSYENVLEYE